MIDQRRLGDSLVFECIFHFLVFLVEFTLLEVIPEIVPGKAFLLVLLSHLTVFFIRFLMHIATIDAASRTFSKSSFCEHIKVGKDILGYIASENIDPSENDPPGWHILYPLC